ncbi:hypothetical protein [Caulobacter sp. Root487D2Y]|uniref:hypothetical protein n=1 Tax=Caulobacter sp. Root487D2Y TaxID=1736547 RepID=UPI000B26E9CC|nr:hypothetical protein [Caulobacter sp. Root487D2Y]
MKRQGLWLLLAAGAAVLGACSTTTAPPMSMTTKKAAPVPDGMKWNYGAGPEGRALLAYGVPESDAVGVMFSCGRKGKTVSLVTDVNSGKPGPGAVRLSSGKVQGRYAVQLTRSEMTGGWEVIGQILLTDPVLAAFEKTGLISQIEDRAYPQDARTAAERADIKRFFGFCRG